MKKFIDVLNEVSQQQQWKDWNEAFEAIARLKDGGRHILPILNKAAEKYVKESNAAELAEFNKTAKLNGLGPAGTVHGRLTVVNRVGKKVICKCSCGNDVVVRYSSIVSGATQSCGCLFRELSGNRPGRKLTNEDVRDIRDLYDSKEKVAWIAKKFGISEPFVSAIGRRKSWGKIAEREKQV